MSLQSNPAFNDWQLNSIKECFLNREHIWRKSLTLLVATTFKPDFPTQPTLPLSLLLVLKDSLHQTCISVLRRFTSRNLEDILIQSCFKSQWLKLSELYMERFQLESGEDHLALNLCFLFVRWSLLRHFLSLPFNYLGIPLRHCWCHQWCHKGGAHLPCSPRTMHYAGLP